MSFHPPLLLLYVFLSSVNLLQEGAEGFLKVQYTSIARIAIFLLAFIVLSYILRPNGGEESEATGVRKIGNATLGIISGGCFLVGALCSAMAGYISMYVFLFSHRFLWCGLCLFLVSFFTPIKTFLLIYRRSYVIIFVAFGIFCRNGQFADDDSTPIFFFSLFFCIMLRSITVDCTY